MPSLAMPPAEGADTTVGAAPSREHLSSQHAGAVKSADADMSAEADSKPRTRMLVTGQLAGCSGFGTQQGMRCTWRLQSDWQRAVHCSSDSGTTCVSTAAQPRMSDFCAWAQPVEMVRSSPLASLCAPQRFCNSYGVSKRYDCIKA